MLFKEKNSKNRRAKNPFSVSKHTWLRVDIEEYSHSMRNNFPWISMTHKLCFLISWSEQKRYIRSDANYLHKINHISTQATTTNSFPFVASCDRETMSSYRRWAGSRRTMLASNLPPSGAFLTNGLLAGDDPHGLLVCVNVRMRCRSDRLDWPLARVEQQQSNCPANSPSFGGPAIISLTI